MVIHSRTLCEVSRSEPDWRCLRSSAWHLLGYTFGPWQTITRRRGVWQSVSAR